MQRLGIQFRGTRFENMVPKRPGAFTKARFGPQVPADSDRGGNSQQQLLGML